MNRSVARAAALALLGIMFARMLHAAIVLSPVVDEQSHISRGLSVLRTGDLRLRIGHPIGLNAWEALPLALDPVVQLPLDDESWVNAAWDRFGDQFLWRVNTNPDGIVFRSRVMVMLLTIVLGAVVFRWANELHGPGAGLVGLTLYTLDPNILAHGMLATTDLGVTLFMFAATYALWHALRSNERRWFITSGVVAGLALVSKYSALFLIPIFGVLILTQIWRERSSSGSQPVRALSSFIPHPSSLILHPLSLILISAVLVALVIYVLRLDLYVGELSFLLANTHTHPSFLLGQRSIQGWWYYFVVTFLLKTPLPTLIVIGIAVVLSLRRRSGRDETFLLVPPVVYFLFSAASSFNVGYRHLLPVAPFLFVYASNVAQIRLPQIVSIRSLFFILLPSAFILLWLALSSLSSHPDYIAYFNEAAPSPSYTVLIDSNLDWGQSLKELRSYLDGNAVGRVKLSYFGTADPAAYGIDYDPLPRWPPPKGTDFVPANPAPGVYAISASNLQGVLLDDPSTFDWFRHRNPDAIVGRSILLYHVAADPNPPQAVGLCREPWTPIGDEQVGALLGRTGLRVVRFDCVNSWWWPNVPVWYVVPPYSGDYRGTGTGLYEQRRPDDSLVYQVSHTDPPGRLAHDPLATPARFDGGLTLLGFTWFGERKVGQEFEVESAWRVDAPLRPPVSIFSHLLDPSGAFVAGADGFGAPAERLRPGDWIAQRHRFAIPADAREGKYTLEFGFYRLDTLERYSVIVDGKPADQRVITEPFDVQK